MLSTNRLLINLGNSLSKRRVVNLLSINYQLEKRGYSLENDPEGDDTFRPPPSGVLRQVLQYQREKPNHLLLTRVGDFYESYFEQADEVGNLLYMTVVDRKFRAFEHPIRFTGFPARQLEKHLITLVKMHGKYVALMDQFQDPLTKLFSRRITRIITPATIMTEQEGNKFILFMLPATSVEKNSVGMAWIDLSTGEFFTKSSLLETCLDDVSRIQPEEILLPTENSNIVDLLKDSGYCVNSPSSSIRQDDTIFFDNHIKSSLSRSKLTTIDQFTLDERRAGSCLLQHVNELEREGTPILSPVTKSLQASSFMLIDRYTLQGLELTKTIREQNKVGSLLETIDYTISPPGKRLLQRRLG